MLYAIDVTIQFLALFCIGILGYNEVGFAVATVPSTLLLAGFSTRFGKLAARYGPRIFMTIGPALMGLGLLWLVPTGPDSAEYLSGIREAVRTDRWVQVDQLSVDDFSTSTM